MLLLMHMELIVVQMPAFALAGGSPAGGYYDGPGVLNNNYDPSSAGYGSTLVAVDLMYIYTDANGCKDTAVNPSMYS